MTWTIAGIIVATMLSFLGAVAMIPVKKGVGRGQ